MVEFRIKIEYGKSINVLNKYAPNGKAWQIDTYTGEWWIKITESENTQRFNEWLQMFLEINEAVDTLRIKDCSKSRTTTHLGDDRSSLFE